MNNKNIESTFKEKSALYKSELRPKLWDKLEKRMDDHYETTAPTQVVNFAWMRYAAAFILLVGAVFLLSQLKDQSPGALASNFTIEDVNSPQKGDEVYKEMVDFSQRHYQTLINPGAKKKSAL